MNLSDSIRQVIETLDIKGSEKARLIAHFTSLLARESSGEYYRGYQDGLEDGGKKDIS